MIKNRAPYIYLPLAFAAVLAGGIFLGTKLNSTNTGIGEGGNRSKFDEVINYVSDEYVDTVSKDHLTELALSLMLSHLDPHSTYIPAADMKAVNESMEGNFEGIGVEFNIQRDTILVVSAIAGGPSEQVGVQAGDRIVTINGERVAGTGIKNQDVIKRLRGNAGSKVTVGIARAGHYKTLLNITITRGKIPIYSVEASYIVEDGIGYIKLGRFAETSYDEFMEAFNKLAKQGMKKLILDLRDNPGGLMNISVAIADEFLSDGKLIVYSEGKNYPRRNDYATTEGNFETKPLVILVDEGSASASEIVAGAIQDNDRGIIVGRRTFGKGLVQHQQMLKDSSAIRLTVARYYTPTGRSIQKPYANGVEDYYGEVGNRFDSGELENLDSIKLDKKNQFKTPKGKLVYGGGGIMPDVFVPLDTMGYTAYYTNLISSGALNDFALNYVDRNRASLVSRFGKNPQAFVLGFVVDDAMVNDLVTAAANKGVAQNPAKLAHSLPLIKNNVKAIIGRAIMGNEASYRTWNADDKTFKKALEVIKGAN